MDEGKEIPIKVYTFWNEYEWPEIRRFNVLQGSIGSFFYLSQKLVAVFPKLKEKAYSVTWRDEDGDDVTISSDAELKTALMATNYESLKIFVCCKFDPLDDCNIFIATPTNVAGATMSAGKAGGTHYGVVCDNCDNVIVGFRYKCTVCDDFDLCSGCEGAGCHPEHCMVRVPAATMPRALIKAAIKRSRQFLKSVAKNEECPYTKRRRDRSGERKHRGHHSAHHVPHGSHGAHHAGDPHRRSRSSWLETFTTYMNEFANLAGDIGLHEDKAKPSGTKPQAQKSGETKEAKTANQSADAPQQPEPNTSANAQTQCPLNPISGNAENLKGLLQKFIQDMQTAVAAQSHDVEMGQGDRKTSEANATENAAASVKSEPSLQSQSSVTSEVSGTSSVNTDFNKDASPDKADGWTMINKEKDLMDASVPAEPAPAIGFNLPEEFQNRVKIHEGGSLYPPLNTSTAVLNPKVPEVAPGAPPTAPEPEGAAAMAAQAAAQRQQQPQPAQQLPQQQPQPQPQRHAMPQRRQRHPRPHIDAAIEQMLAMGFTNDGDWLTQLLESKDGNIAAVLDLLTPVKPKK